MALPVNIGYYTAKILVLPVRNAWGTIMKLLNGRLFSRVFNTIYQLWNYFQIDTIFAEINAPGV